jgi:hypothetical protein
MSLSFAAYSETAIAESTTTLDASAFMTGATASASAGTLAYDAKASTDALPAATATFTAAAFGDVDAQANITLPAATVVISSGTLQPNVDEDLVSVSATTAVGPLSATGKANVTPAGATSTTVSGTLDYDAKANITLDAATADADLTVNDLSDEDAQATATLSGVSATTTANWDTENGIYAVQVIYLEDDFERTRTVNIVPYGNYKVYVTR